MFTTPSGSPASSSSSPSRSAVSGVCSAGFSTLVLPQASAGPSFHAAMRSGKFHGMICPHTPTGSEGEVEEGLVRGVRLAVDLVHPAGVVTEGRGRGRDVEVAALHEWLAVVLG